MSERWVGLIRKLIDGKRVVLLGAALLVAAGLSVAPFSFLPAGVPLPRAPLAVDALPDLGENQQIVFTEWPGRSPQDVDDEITFPLETALAGLPGVRTVRGSSTFGASSIYVIFDQGVDVYWSRTRVAEKLGSLPAGTLPAGVTPVLGPEATALGQVFWYTLEARDPSGNVVGGWDLHELRSLHDSIVRTALQSVPGVAEVASVGGHVQEYQVDVDPTALAKHHVDLSAVVEAVRAASSSVGARTLEINSVEYIVRGIGQVTSTEELEQAVVHTRDGKTVTLDALARVVLGPALRRGALDEAGAEAVGGVVVARFGGNPMEIIQRVRRKIAEIAPGLPERTLEDGRKSRVTIAPFYDRSSLIRETLGTLSDALWQQILVTVLTVLLLMRSLRGALLIAGVLPLAVLGSLVAMKLWRVEVNFMAMAGISIAIGTMVDMAIVLSENMVARWKAAPPGAQRADVLARAGAEVAPAVLTAGLTTAVSFLPVFAFTGVEGKLFSPMAYTKTFAMFSALLVTLIVLPPVAHLALRFSLPSLGKASPRVSQSLARAARASVVGVFGVAFAAAWRPLGGRGLFLNFIFVGLLLAFLFLGLWALRRGFARALRWSLLHKGLTLAVPATVVAVGLAAWLGLPRWQSQPGAALSAAFPGFGREFMPPFDEGAFLYMPSMTDHASIGQSLGMLRQMDAAIQTIPEVERAVGKLGRVESALDPAPISMFETLVTYVPEYRIEPSGARIRQWRNDIRTPDDIWREIVRVTEAPGLTSAPKLMPINTRVLMLQTGMRANTGIKLFGPNVRTLEAFGVELSKHLKEVPGIRRETVFAERIVGKPTLSIDLDRKALAAHGVTVEDVQRVIEAALGGAVATRVSVGRERYAVRVRYAREFRDSLEAMRGVLVPVAGGPAVPLATLAELRYERTPGVIRSEDARLSSFVVFDHASDVAEVDAVEQARAHLDAAIATGRLKIPAGVSYTFAGTYESHVRSQARLRLLVPLALAIMILLVHLEFRRASHTAMVVSSIAICMAGGFLLVWLYGKPWFLRLQPLAPLGIDLRELFSVGAVNLSVAVWVGFIALLGIATDAGVVLGIFLARSFAAAAPATISEIHTLAVQAAERRVLPCVMTTAAAALSLLPIFTARGRGADVMLPMALPSVGGMVTVLFTLFTVPALFVWREERALRARQRAAGTAQAQ